MSGDSRHAPSERVVYTGPAQKRCAGPVSDRMVPRVVSVSGNSYVCWIKSWAARMIRRWRVPIVAAQRVGTDSGRPYAGRWIRQSSAWRCRGSCQLRAAAGGVLAAERRPVRVKQARTACSALGRVHGRVSRAEPSRSCRSDWQVTHKPSELKQLLALMAQLAALTDAVTRLREAQDRAVQAKAARKAAEKLRAASARYARPGAPLMAASPSPVTVVGGRATGPRPPFESDRPGPSAAPHRGPHQ